MTVLLDSLSAAIGRRRSLFGALEMFRLVDGDGDDLPGIFIDKFGSTLLVHLVGVGGRASECESELTRHADEICRRTESGTLYCRVHAERAGKTSAVQLAPLFGPATPEFVCGEGQVRYLIRPESQVNAGLFLDTRILRQDLFRNACGKRVLNTFCFTGTLGVAAWCGGAREVVQVDVSNAALQWARENASLNESSERGQGGASSGFKSTRGIPSRHAQAPERVQKEQESSLETSSRVLRYIKDDARVFIEREARRSRNGRDNWERYDIVIIDPPSFGQGGARAFSLRRDLGAMVATASELVSEGGRLIVTVNQRGFSPRAVEELVRDSVQRAGRSVTRCAEVRPPAPDFNTSIHSSLAVRGVDLVLR